MELKEDLRLRCRLEADFTSVGRSGLEIKRIYEAALPDTEVANLRTSVMNSRKKEKQRKFPLAAFRLVPSPRYFANLFKDLLNNVFTYGTYHANLAPLPERHPILASRPMRISNLHSHRPPSFRPL